LDNDGKLQMNIELNNIAVIGLLIGYLFCGIVIFQSGSLIFIIPVII